MCYVVLGTHVFKPACTASARCDYGMLCADFTVFAVFLDICATASLALYYYIGTLPAEHYLNAVFLKVFFNCKIKLLCLFGAEVAYRAVNKAKSCLNGFQSDVFYLFGVSDSLDLIIGAELKIYLICVVYHLGGIFVAYKLGEHSADIGRERQLSVRKCACARKAGCYVTVRLAVHTAPCCGLRAFAFLDGATLFDDYYFLFAVFSDHFKRSEYSCRTCADYCNIISHLYHLRIGVNLLYPSLVGDPSIPLRFAQEDSGALRCAFNFIFISVPVHFHLSNLLSGKARISKTCRSRDFFTCNSTGKKPRKILYIRCRKT